MLVNPPKEELSFLSKKNPEKSPTKESSPQVDQNLQPSNEIPSRNVFTHTEINKSPQKTETTKEKETVESHNRSPIKPQESPINPDTIAEKSVQKISPKAKEAQKIAEPEKPKSHEEQKTEETHKPANDPPSIFKTTADKDPASTESKGKLFGFNTQNPLTFSGTSSNPPTGGLFLQNKPNTANPAGSLFQNLPATNLFGPSNPSIFQSNTGNTTTGTNLFGQPVSQGGLFSSLFNQSPNTNSSIGLQNKNTKNGMILFHLFQL